MTYMNVHTKEPAMTVIGSDPANAMLFRGSADCVKVLDVEGRLKLINPGGVLSLELERPDQLNGEVWWHMWPSPGTTFAEEAFNVALDGKVRVFSGACPTAKGTERWWEVTVSPIRDSNGSVDNVLVVSRDITELAKTKAALELALNRKDEILATVAHELRNPLGAAMSAAQLLALRELPSAEVARIALLITRQLGHISRMAEDLIDTARIAHGELSFTPARVDVNGVVQIAVEQIRASAEKKNQTLTLTLCGSGCDVIGDETRLVQAVGNIVANAVRYTPKHGSIDVSVVSDGITVEVTTKDSGMGLASDRLDDLFDRYARVQTDTTRANAGLGLGLSLVKTIVEMHGGTVSAASAGVGKGSSFTMRLQTATEQPDEGVWLIDYQTPEGEQGTLKRQFDHAPNPATVAVVLREALLPQPLPVVSRALEEEIVSLRLLEGLGYRITNVSPQQ
jgi:PAS domain S-box-containing protein